jgi:hypothetical protein
VGGDAILSSDVGRRDSTVLLSHSSTPPVHTSWPAKASWFFKTTLNLLQANALPFLVPSPTRLLSPTLNQFLRLLRRVILLGK